MSDLSKPDDTNPDGPWFAVKKAFNRLQDWFATLPWHVRLALLVTVLAIVGSSIYCVTLLHRHAMLAAQVEAMNVEQRTDGGRQALDENMPVVIGPGSVLGFLDNNPVERVTVIYQALMWDVSERVILVQSRGREYAYYPSDMESKIFSDKAVTASWGSKLVFVPRSELSPKGRELMESLDMRFSGALPQSEKERWKTAVSSLVPSALLICLVAFLYFQFKGQFKSLKFIEPAQVDGSIDDLVGMDDIKEEIAQIKDQYERRADYAEYGVSKTFNVMFSGPAGTGKTKLASYLAKELHLPILFHSAANLETGFVAGGGKTLDRIMAMAARRRRCVVFLDEAQDLFMKRGGRRKFDDDTANTLLSVLDGVRSTSDTEVIWIVASNFNSETMQMDEAMLRRFQMKVDFRMPNREERQAIIDHYLSQRAGKVLPDQDLRHLVAVTEGRSPADLETIVNQAGIAAVQAGEMIGADTLMQAAERVLVGNVNSLTTQERERDRRIIATHEWGHFLVDLEHERRRTGDDWQQLFADMKTIKISLKANPRTNALGFVFHKQGPNLLKSKGDIEHEIRVLLGGMANEELFFGEQGTTNGAHDDIRRVTKLLHHAVAEIGMFGKSHLNFGSLSSDRQEGDLDEETRRIMEAQSERLFQETKAILARFKPLTAHLVEKLMEAHEMGLQEALREIREFEAGAGSADGEAPAD